ncbi:Metal-sulfur cluster biosynthetic enzyme [Actinacidiphila alni]|uniref:Metal-sulfur cluster biosynthetic enzyme n=1 Tax=Actinacidiphila alni TaxID=380248 RepID=A0A1I2EDM6_9ACTN|nr:iron-sulfur cluster assembly protein [Actinacidiphila alni]SFE90955.1 Metal-sulfur cluster biosynthetic enzyme [Actinacidiphila alni]
MTTVTRPPDRTRTGVEERVWAALGTVRDPELDQPITALCFVTEAVVRDHGPAGSAVLVRLRLPTYFCAPNFAFLMVADAHDAVRAVPGVTAVEIRLEDHFAADEINAGVAAQGGFAGTFPQLAGGELAELRLAFLRKAHLACLERACRRLRQDGWQVEDLTRARLSDLPASPERDSLLRRRADLGLPTDHDAPLVVHDDGTPVSADDLPARLRFARAVRVSVDGNATMCRGLLETRYGVPAADEHGTDGASAAPSPDEEDAR